MDLTFYGQFVIGREEKTVRPIIERYLKDGVGPILYYALEEDKSSNNRSFVIDFIIILFNLVDSNLGSIYTKRWHLVTIPSF